MSRIARQALVISLLALYGSVSFCGLGLHTLLERTLADHDHGSGKDDSATISGVSHDCLLCEFQAQAQLHSTVIPEPSRPLAVERVHVTPTFPVVSDRHTSCSPRAPPLDRLTIS